MRYDYDYVIVGAGMSAHSAARGIRERDPNGSILIIGQEPDQPYSRPMLSKDLWFKSNRTESDALLNTEAKTGATIMSNTQVVEFRPEDHVVLTDASDLVQYRKILLATGGTPRTIGDPAERIIYFRTLADYRTLRRYSGPGQHVIVIGGGFVGTELACGLAHAGTKVTMILAETELGVRNFPSGIRARLARVFAEHGIEIMEDCAVKTIAQAPNGQSVTVTLTSGEDYSADAVVAGLGIIPNIELASDAGLATEGGGVVVDRFLQTSDTDVFASGDIAFYIDPLLGRRRIEHVDQAESSGRTAGRNMVSADEPYDHTPLFYSDLFDDGYEAVGMLNAELDMFEDWEPGKENAQGVVYYLDQGAVRGVLLWNVWDSTDLAREVLREYGEPDSVKHPEQLKGRIPTG